MSMSSTSSSEGTPIQPALALDFSCRTTRYKYLQRPLEASSLPTLLQYIHRWTPAQTEKLAIAIGLLISQGLASASCLVSLTKDHLVKNGTQIFRIYRPLTHRTFIYRCIRQCHHAHFQSLSDGPADGSSFCYVETWRCQGHACFFTRQQTR